MFRPREWALGVFGFYFCSAAGSLWGGRGRVPFELSLSEEGVQGEGSSQGTLTQHIVAPALLPLLTNPAALPRSCFPAGLGDPTPPSGPGLDGAGWNSFQVGGAHPRVRAAGTGSLRGSEGTAGQEGWGKGWPWGRRHPSQDGGRWTGLPSQRFFPACLSLGFLLGSDGGSPFLFS